MTDDECLQRFGLTPPPESAQAIRQLLSVETEKERRRQGDADGELMKLNCIQLFSIGDPGDALLIWRAKQSSFDKGSYIDVQLLCGAGISETKDHLFRIGSDEARAVVQHIGECEATGDFEGFTNEALIEEYRDYYDV